jgi:hypothetical protein
MTVAQKTWTAGDVATAADLNTYARGGQEMGYAEITASSASFTTEADVASLTVTWTAISTRVYKLIFDGNVVSTVAGYLIGIYITDNAHTHVAEGYSGPTGTNLSQCNHFEKRITGLTGSVTYKVRAQRVSGTGTCTINAAAGRPAFFQVLDVGAN